MKKFFTVATMFALVAGFAACSSSDDGGSTPPAAPAEVFVNRATSNSGLTLAATHHFLEVSAEAGPTEIKFAVYNNGQDVTSEASGVNLASTSFLLLLPSSTYTEASDVTS